MTYRDDHDAALARAAALEKELADARAEHHRDEEKIAKLEAELRARPRPKRTHKRPPGRAVWIAALAAGVLVVAVPVVVLVQRHRAARDQVAAGWDVQQYLAEAVADATSQWSDAELMKITADYVDSTGRAQLDVDGARLSYWFRSPSRAQPPDPPSRIGLPAPTRTKPCQLRERIHYKGDTSLSSDTQTDSSPGCGASVPGPLRCTVREIWQRAIAKGAPASALASIWLRTEGDPPKRTWHFEINDATHAHDVRVRFDDDCH